jgi:hypothetical protein
VGIFGPSVKNHIRNEIFVLTRNVPIMSGRDIGMDEVGLALGVFMYWRLGFESLSEKERIGSVLYFLNDCRWAVYALYRRLLAIGFFSPPMPDNLIEPYVNQQIEDVNSLLGCVTQCADIFVESYLLSKGLWPMQSSWELMPRLAHLPCPEFYETVRGFIEQFASEKTGEAVLPMSVIRSPDHLSQYGNALAEGFLVRSARR